MKFPSIAVAAAILARRVRRWPPPARARPSSSRTASTGLQPTWGEESDSFKVVDGQLEVSPAADSYHWVGQFREPLRRHRHVRDDDHHRAGSIRSRPRPGSSSGMSTSTISTSSSWRRTARPRSGGASAASGWRRSIGAMRRAPTRATAPSTNCASPPSAAIATFYINGTQFEELEGSPPENGQQIGLFAASPPGGPARFGFDNLKVTKP